MRITVRMTARFVDQVTADLERPHSFAAERLGFVLARWARSGEDLLVFPYEYRPVADDHYLRGHRAGATINAAAIRAALQASLDTGTACLHVHVHAAGMPWFSALDLEEQDKLIPSFVAVNTNAPHGALVFSGHQAAARVWPPGGARPIERSRVAVVGYPLRLGGAP